MTVLITLTVYGSDTGPYFDLYSDVDGYATPFETNVTKLDLIAGYTSTLVPDFATIIRIQSKGECTNYVDISVETTTTTTTTCLSLYPISLRLGETELGACGATDDIYYMDTVAFDVGSYIFEDSCGSIPISSSFVIEHGSGVGYNCVGNLITSLTGSSC